MHHEEQMADKLESGAPKDVRFDIEREKLALERLRLDVEREKVVAGHKRTKWIALAIMIPLLVVAATLWVWLVQQYREGRDDDALKAAEIIRSTQPNKSSQASVADKKELLGLLAAHPGQQADIVAYWKTLFPNDDWVIPLQQAIQERARTRKSAFVAKPQASVVASERVPNPRQEPPFTAKDFGGEAFGIEIPQPGGQSSPNGSPDDSPVFR
jgi:hypothetical protein